MRNLPVKSGLIECIYFSPEDGQLHLRLRDGKVRVFAEVPELEVQAMIEAPSPGHYYIDKIRNRYTRLAT